MAEPTYSIRWVRLDAMNVIPTLQRERREYWVEDLAVNFDPDRFGVPELADELEGATNVIIVGQHRCEAARRALGANQKVQCKVWSNIDSHFAARLFRAEDHRLATRTLDAYNLALLAEEDWAVAIDKTVTPLGYRISDGNRGPTLQCVGALQTAFMHGQLTPVVAILHDLWPLTSWRSFTVNAMASLLMACPDLDRERLAYQLRSKTQDDVLHQARTIHAGWKAEGRPGSLTKALTDVIAKAYNNRLHTGRLTQPSKGWPLPNARLPIRKAQAKRGNERSKARRDGT